MLFRLLLCMMMIRPFYAVDGGGGAADSGAGSGGDGGSAQKIDGASGGADAGASGASGADAGKGAPGSAAAGADGGKGAASGASGAAAGDGAKGSGAAAGDDGKAGTWWTDGWRDGYAKGDAKKAERLARYASPEAVADALLSLQSKIGAGELRAQLPKNATDEQVAAWRKEHGIPAAPAEYKVELRSGAAIEEEDRPIIDTILGVVHKSNGDNTLANTMVNTYYDIMEQRLAARQEADQNFAQAEEDALRVEWGQDYRTNTNMIKALLDGAPDDVRELIQRGRLANGDPFFAHRGAMKWLANLARQINPVSALVPGGGANVGHAIEDEIASIEKTMRENRDAYNKDEKMQGRLRELYGARERLGKAA